MPTEDKKKLTVLLSFFLILPMLFGQVSDSQKKLRIKLWAPVDEEPGLISPDISGSSRTGNSTLPSNYTDTATSSIKVTAPFFLSGMIYGWKFEYTPSDKARQVAEYFSLTPIHEIDINDPAIHFASPATLENRVYCWVEYDRTLPMMTYRQSFDSVNIPQVKGTGESSKKISSEAIIESVEMAAKNAIRNYGRIIEKNKPKVITGTILLKDQDPTVKIVNGKFTSYLDFFLHVDTIIQYSNF